MIKVAKQNGDDKRNLVTVKGGARISSIDSVAASDKYHPKNKRLEVLRGDALLDKAPGSFG